MNKMKVWRRIKKRDDLTDTVGSLIIGTYFIKYPNRILYTRAMYELQKTHEVKVLLEITRPCKSYSIPRKIHHYNKATDAVIPVVIENITLHVRKYMLRSIIT